MSSENDKYIGIIETEKGNCLSIIQRDNILIAGGSTNCFMFETYKMEIDDCFSFDENLQEFIEMINDEESKEA
jgi:hypothetical protein